MTPTPIGLRALVVDDEAPARADLTWLLDREDSVASVTVASDANEALRALHTEEVDVVFLDVRMPGLHGLDLARVLHRFASPPQVVFRHRPRRARRRGLRAPRLRPPPQARPRRTPPRSPLPHPLPPRRPSVELGIYGVDRLDRACVWLGQRDHGRFRGLDGFRLDRSCVWLSRRCSHRSDCRLRGIRARLGRRSLDHLGRGWLRRWRPDAFGRVGRARRYRCQRPGSTRSRCVRLRRSRRSRWSPVGNRARPTR